MRFTSETARAAGKKGGRTTKRKYGVTHYRKLGKKGTRIQWSQKKKSSVKEGR